MLELGQGTVTHEPTAAAWWRRDVQGLRAIAILAVVAFHAGLPLGGGFAGVDVFFVISGYVIGGLLVRGLLVNRGFPAKSFYLRRARRLLPAAALMIISVTLLSGVLLSPVGRTQQAAGDAAAAASTFLANAYFLFNTGGYFQPDAESNPFLHMWSLSVEEQFYFALPWLLTLTWGLSRRRRIRNLATAVALAAAISFGLSAIFTFSLVPESTPVVGPNLAEYPDWSQAFAFFSPVTRSWEFLLGVGVLLLSHRWEPRSRNALLLAGLGSLLLTLTFVLARPGVAFPGLWALVPTLGTAALILAGGARRPTKVTQVLTGRWLVRIGDLSYGWYLWHWPMIVFAQLWLPGLWPGVLGAVASLALALASRTWLEEPIRAKRALRSGRSMALAACLCIVVPLVGGLGLARTAERSWWREDVASIREVIEQPHLDTRSGCIDLQSVSEACLFSAQDAVGSILLVGDSTAGMYTEPLARIASDLGYNLKVATRNGCPIQSGFSSANAACQQFNQSVINDPQRYDLTVVVNSGSYAYGDDHTPSDDGIEAFSRSAAAAAKKMSKDNNRRVLVIAPIAQYGPIAFPDCLVPSVAMAVDYGCADLPASLVKGGRDRLASSLARQTAGRDDDVFLFDPSTVLCDKNRSCPGYRDGILLYRDRSHLSVPGSMLLIADLKEQIRRALGLPFGR